MRPRPLFLTVPLLLGGCIGADSNRGIDYRPAADVLRVLQHAQPAPAVGGIIDFAAHDGRLYLLDARGAVVVFGRSGDSWRQELSFGRSGEGPGEFRYPSSISIHDGTIVVAEAARLQFFDTTGRLVTTRPFAPICSMLRPAVFASAHGVYLHGDCHRSGLRTDTTVAVLAYSTDTVTFEVIAREVRYTRDGTVGNAFNMAPAFSAGTGAHHLFGVGTTNCVWQISTVDARNSERACPAVRVQYRSDPPAALKARLERGSAALKIEWPEPMPPYVERTAVPAGDVLVRPFSADSVVLQLTAPRSTDLAVAPLEGLVRCNDAGCLWIIEHTDRSDVIHLDVAALERLIRERAGS